MSWISKRKSKVKDFDSELAAEASGKLKWKDSPTHPWGNVLHYVNKKDLTVAFTDVLDGQGLYFRHSGVRSPEDGVDDHLDIALDQRTELPWNEVKKTCRVLVEYY